MSLKADIDDLWQRKQDGMARLRDASETIPLLKATNFSPGIQVLQRLVSEAIGTFDDVVNA